MTIGIVVFYLLIREKSDWERLLHVARLKLSIDRMLRGQSCQPVIGHVFLSLLFCLGLSYRLFRTIICSVIVLLARLRDNRARRGDLWWRIRFR